MKTAFSQAEVGIQTLAEDLDSLSHEMITHFNHFYSSWTRASNLQIKGLQVT